MKFRDKVLFFIGSLLTRERDNPYSYTCRRCGMFFITIGDSMFSSWRDEIVPGYCEIPDPKCKCLEIYNRKYWR